MIERVRGIGVASLMLLQILFSMPTALGVRVICLPNVPCWCVVAAHYCGVRAIYWCGTGLTDV